MASIRRGEVAGWVVREPAPRDRRVCMVVLTDAGRDAVGAGVDALVSGGFGPVGSVGQQQRHALSALLADLRGAPPPRPMGEHL